MKLQQFVLRAAIVAALFAGAFPAAAQWSKIPSGTTDNLLKIQFTSSDTGYILGYSTLLKTTDGGDNWTTVLSFPEQFPIAVYSMFFNDNLTGFISSPEALRRTDDGGVTWTTVTTLPANTSIWFVRPDLWFSFLSDETGPVTKRSTDQGLTWETATGIMYQPGRNGICFPTADTGYAVYRSGLARSIDTGKTWTEVISYGTDKDFPFSILETCYFTDAVTGYIGGWYNGALSKTADGGINWTHNPEGYQLYDITFLTKTIGYATGWHGAIFKTVDGGNSWEPEGTGIEESYTLYDVYFRDENTGFIVGDYGTILKRTAATPTSTPESSLAAQITVTSDPATGHIAIHLPDGRYSALQVQLFSVMGKQVYQNTATSSEQRIDIATSGLSNGMYFLHLSVNGETIVKQVAILR